MNNVSFKANLVVNKNLYTKIPEGTPQGYTDNLVEEYKKFLDIPVIKKVTEGDTIELYKDRYNRGFAIGIKYTTDKLDEPLKSGIYTNKKIPSVKSCNLIFDTMVYLIIKSGIKQGIVESTEKSFVRAVKKLLDDSKNMI